MDDRKKGNIKSTENFRDSISTVDEKGKRIWIYPQKPKGPFYNKRTLLSIVFIAAFIGFPFIKIDGEPIFLFNVLERKFILFGQVFWPQDFFIFGLGMLLFIVFIVLFTVVFGRVFCGWVCPQTVFLELVFRRIEYWLEGDAQYQQILNKGPNDFNKIWRKTVKHVLFYAIAFIVSNTFLAYIIGVDQLIKIVTEPVSMHVGGLIGMMIFSGVFYGVFAFMREQVCTTVCPYGRLQGLMLDNDSIVVAYDHVRGEERGKFHKNEERKIGDCIDCGLCVKVCPTGIDIRNGTQLECTNCTACIDVCDDMMTKVGMKKGLIRYTSENRILGKQKKVFTTRMKAYVAVLIILVGVETSLIISRKTVDASINRTRGMLYQEMDNGRISNLYSIKIFNKKDKPTKIELKPDGFKGEIQWVGQPVHLKGSGKGEGMFFLIVDGKSIHKRKTKFNIKVMSNGEEVDNVRTSFFSPTVN